MRDTTAAFSSATEIVDKVRALRKRITVFEERSQATLFYSFHYGGTPGELLRNLIQISGGDMLCRPEFYYELIAELKEIPDVHVLMETNGVSLSEQRIEKLCACRLDSVCLSLDSVDEAEYRQLYGMPMNDFGPLMRSIVAANANLELRTVVYPPTVAPRPNLSRLGEFIASVDPEIPVTLIPYTVFQRGRLVPAGRTAEQDLASAARALESAGIKKIWNTLNNRRSE